MRDIQVIERLEESKVAGTTSDFSTPYLVFCRKMSGIFPCSGKTTTGPSLEMVAERKNTIYGCISVKYLHRLSQSAKASTGSKKLYIHISLNNDPTALACVSLSLNSVIKVFAPGYLTRCTGSPSGQFGQLLRGGRIRVSTSDNFTSKVLMTSANFGKPVVTC